MTKQDYENICRTSHSGIQKFVENTRTRQTGRVISCRGGEFVVDAEGHRDTWEREICREQGYYGPSYS